MMDARTLTKALGGRWSGSYGACRCPAHEDQQPSLSVRDGDDAPLLTCHAGCDRAEIIDALKDRGLWKSIADHCARSLATVRPAHNRRDQLDDDPAKRTMAALEIWHTSIPAEGTLAEVYLRSRGITIPPPPSLRFHPALKHGPTGLPSPAMVAAIQGADRKITAIHRTFLKADGTGKAGVSAPKMALGPIGDGAVRLGPAGKALGIAEGVETGLSAMQIFEIPVWCRCGSNLEAMTLPAEVRELQIFADNGDAGRMAAVRARDYAATQRRRVFIRRPPEQFNDWNDALGAVAGAT